MAHHFSFHHIYSNAIFIDLLNCHCQKHDSKKNKIQYSDAYYDFYSSKSNQNPQNEKQHFPKWL